MAESAAGLIIRFVDLTAKPIMTPLIILFAIAAFINRVRIAIDCIIDRLIDKYYSVPRYLVWV